MIPHRAPLRPAHYITYYGDIYNGSPESLSFEDKTWFIVSLNQRQKFRDLQPHERTIDRYRELGWEISDNAIIDWNNVITQGELGNTDNHLNLQRTGDQDKPIRNCKRVFIFGAGASANSFLGTDAVKIKNSPFKPPLGFEVLDERFKPIVRKYPGAFSNVSYFEDTGKDIEAAMEKEWEVIRNTYSPETVISHINLQYYLFDLFREVSKETKENYFNNLYSLMAKKLLHYLSGHNDEYIGMVSFNYDTILEDSFSSTFHLPFKNMQDYVDWDKRQIILFKPHGSCNWGWQFNEDRIADIGQRTISDYLLDKKYTLDKIYYQLLGQGNLRDMVAYDGWGHEQNLNLHFKGRYTVNKNKIEVIPTGSNKRYFPALLLPYRDKDEFLMHYDHQTILHQSLSQATELYLIGWKGNEDVFNRYVKRMAGSFQKIVIVNPNESINQEVSNNLKKYNINYKEIEVVHDFEQFVTKDFDRYLEQK